MVFVDPVIPEDRLPPLDNELIDRVRGLDLGVDLDVANSETDRALARALLFEWWPNMMRPGMVGADVAVDPLTRFYNRYYWFCRYAALWQRDHGFDAGLKQQELDILAQAEAGADWALVEQLHDRAAKVDGVADPKAAP